MSSKISGVFFVLLVAIWSLGSSDTNAATVLYSVEVDIKDPNTLVQRIPDEDVEVFLPGIYNPGSKLVTLNPGDTLIGTVSFGKDRLEISDTIRHARQILTFYPFISSDLSSTWSNSTLTLLDVQGDYLGPNTIYGVTSGAVLGSSMFLNLTHSAFSFSGVQFTLNYERGSTNTFDPYVAVQFTHVLVDVISGSAVPESATWVSMILGLGMIGGVSRLKRKGARGQFALVLHELASGTSQQLRTQP